MKKIMLLLLTAFIVSTYGAQDPIEFIVGADQEVGLVSYILDVSKVNLEKTGDRIQDIKVVKDFLKNEQLTSGHFYESLPDHPRVAFGCYMNPASQEVEWKLNQDKKLETEEAKQVWELLLK